MVYIYILYMVYIYIHIHTHLNFSQSFSIRYELVIIESIIENKFFTIKE